MTKFRYIQRVQELEQGLERINKNMLSNHEDRKQKITEELKECYKSSLREYFRIYKKPCKVSFQDRIEEDIREIR